MRIVSRSTKRLSTTRASNSGSVRLARPSVPEKPTRACLSAGHKRLPLSWCQTVSQSEISIHAYGETHLLVPTGPGVREPQNRRVEIVLQ